MTYFTYIFVFTDGFLMSADFYRVQDKNIFSGHNTRTLLYLDFWYNAWFIRYTFLLQYLSNISETPYNITFCSLACVTYFNKREKNEIDGNLIWESEFRSHYVGRLKFFRPFRVYDAHDMWNDFKDSGVRKAKHAWRETASGIWMLLVCSCEKNISRRNNYLLDVSHLSFTLSVRLSFLSFPFPNYPSHLFSYFPPSVYLSFLPSLSLTKFHYI